MKKNYNKKIYIISKFVVTLQEQIKNTRSVAKCLKENLFSSGFGSTPACKL